MKSRQKKQKTRNKIKWRINFASAKIQISQKSRLTERHREKKTKTNINEIKVRKAFQEINSEICFTSSIYLRVSLPGCLPK